jgi:hypothetical protein
MLTFTGMNVRQRGDPYRQGGSVRFAQSGQKDDLRLFNQIDKSLPKLL